MSVVVSIEDAGPCRKQLKVEVPAPAVEAETARVIQGLSRQVRIPGFRKGKVPAAVIKRRFQEDIEKEVLERLVPRYWNQARAESNLDPLLPPQVEEVNLEAGEGLTFVATVEIRPEIELGDLDGFDLPEPDLEPTEEELTRALEDLRRGATRWTAVERPAAGSDRVTGRITEITHDAVVEPRPMAIELGSERLWPELDAAVTGLEAGGSAEFERTEPAEDGDRRRRFRVVVDEVLEGAVPDLDDELARKLGEFEDLAALRRDVGDRLRAAKANERRRLRERALLDQLRERHPLQLPEGVVDHEVEHLLNDYAGGLARQGVDLDTAEIDWRRLAADVRPQAEHRVHARLLLDAAASSRGIEISEEEFEAALAAIAQSEGSSALAVRRALDRQGRLAELRAQLRRRRILAALLGVPEEGGADEGGDDAGTGPSGAEPGTTASDTEA